MHERGADGEAIEPGLGVGGRAKCFPVSHGSDSDILHDVVGTFKSAEAGDGDGAEPGAVHSHGLVRVSRQGEGIAVRSVAGRRIVGAPDLQRSPASVFGYVAVGRRGFRGIQGMGFGIVFEVNAGDFGFVPPMEAEGEVDHHEDVANEDENTKEGDFANNFDDFEGQESGGGDDGEPFGPGLVEEKSEAFNEVKTGIDECAGIEIKEGSAADAEGFFKESVNVFVVFVDAEVVDEIAEGVVEVAVEVDHVEEVDAHNDECCGLDEFINRNEPHEEQRVAGALVEGFGLGRGGGGAVVMGGSGVIGWSSPRPNCLGSG